MSAPSVASPSAAAGSPRVSAPAFPHGCRSAANAIRFYSARTHSWQAKRYGGLADRIRWPNCRRAVAAAKEWRARAVSARESFLRWYRYHFDWRDWLPSNWLSVAICESGKNPPNWQHDSVTYVSAFGIFRPGYADDAHRIGALSWDETLDRLRRYPTPREQYEAALSHYRANGDGWGCAGP